MVNLAIFIFVQENELYSNLKFGSHRYKRNENIKGVNFMKIELSIYLKLRFLLNSK